MARMTDGHFERLLLEDQESGGAAYPDIVREARRARESEARLLEALRTAWDGLGMEDMEGGLHDAVVQKVAAALKAAERDT